MSYIRAAQDAFEITLHRLRKLLRGEDTIRLEGGLVTLDSRHVWLDSQAFEQCADAIQQIPEASAPDQLAVARRVDEALRLYTGHFLADQSEQPWALHARERLRSKLERLIGRAGAHWERIDALAQATSLYQRAIELDPLAEAVYRHLMRAHAKAGRKAEALATYHRCHHMLSVVLGIAPSPETEALRASFAP